MNKISSIQKRGDWAQYSEFTLSKALVVLLFSILSIQYTVSDLADVLWTCLSWRVRIMKTSSYPVMAWQIMER